MAVPMQIIDKLNSFYKEIDLEIDQLKISQKCLVTSERKKTEACKLKRSDSSEDDKELTNIIKSVREADENVKKVVEKKTRRIRNTRPAKSSFCPIWNDNKLNSYIQNVLNDMMKSPDDEESKEPIGDIEEYIDNGIDRTTIPNDFMNNETRISTRNVGTNIRFLIHDTVENNLKNEKRNLCAVKRVNRKTQTGCPNDLKIGANKVNEKSFPQRVERVVNNDESVSVNFKKNFKVSTAPLQLAFSDTTYTSTNGHKKSTSLTTRNNVMHVSSSNLVTNDTKQMSKVLLPVLSIKGKCSVQKIYHFEISPATNEALQQCSRDNDDGRNVKFIEVKYVSSSTRDCVQEIVTDDITKDVTSPELPENRNKFINVNDIRNALRHYNVNIDDGKIRVVIENANKNQMPRQRRRRRRWKKRCDFKVVASKNIPSAEEKLAPNEKNVEMPNEVDSSSSLTDDDRKLSDILKFYGKTNETKEEKGNKHDNIFSSEDRYPTYPYPTNTSSNETHNNMTNEVKKSNELEYNVITESFQSIYKLIENTFQSNLVDVPVVVDEKESENGMREMNQVIKLSEENIKKAEVLLKKYQISKKREERHPFTADRQSCHNLMTENPEMLGSSNKVNLDIDRGEKCDENNVNNSCYLEKASVPHTDININDGSMIQQQQNYEAFSQDLQLKMQRTVENSAVQTTSDKNFQTDDNFDWKTRYYFKTVYDNYSNIDFDKAKFSATKQKGVSKVDDFIDNPVPYNPIYSNDDEIMNVANKFLRSIEKEKQRNIEFSEDESPHYYQSLALKESSSSISTPLSDLINNEDYFAAISTEKPSNIPKNLDYTYSDGEIMSLGEVRLLSSLSDESSSLCES